MVSDAINVVAWFSHESFRAGIEHPSTFTEHTHTRYIATDFVSGYNETSATCLGKGHFQCWQKLCTLTMTCWIVGFPVETAPALMDSLSWHRLHRDRKLACSAYRCSEPTCTPDSKQEKHLSNNTRILLKKLKSSAAPALRTIMSVQNCPAVSYNVSLRVNNGGNLF